MTEKKDISRNALEAVAYLSDLGDKIVKGTATENDRDTFFYLLKSSLHDVSIAVAEMGIEYDVDHTSRNSVNLLKNLDIMFALLGLPTYSEFLMGKTQ